MNRTIKNATVKRFHYNSHAQLEQHLADFLDAYNCARRLKTLKGVRRQAFWDKWRADLAEALAHLGFQFRRPPCGEASAAG